MKIARLFVTHLWSPEIEIELNLLSECKDADTWLLLGPPFPVGTVNFGHSLCHAISDASLSKLPYTRIQTTGLIGHGHFLILEFFRKHPYYDYYWFIEYDVRYTDNWSTLFRRYSLVKADLLTTHIRHFSEEPLWPWWPTFGRTAAAAVPVRHCIRSFNVIYRISNSALQFLDHILQRGWHGHHEVLLPTLLYWNKFGIADFGGHGSFTDPAMVNSAYTSSGSRSGYLSVLGTIRFRPARGTPGQKEMMLYHPVKPCQLLESPEQKRIAYQRWQRELQHEVHVARHSYRREHFAAEDFLHYCL